MIKILAKIEQNVGYPIAPRPGPDCLSYGIGTPSLVAVCERQCVRFISLGNFGGAIPQLAQVDLMASCREHVPRQTLMRSAGWKNEQGY